ncbi:MAG: hypothetical protein CO028_04080 [Candidatus Levybacteria bacterium CG_4_9_14_0_2_um_filter_35_21]|nr:MAG: hypothetical protein CO028_04080 [Candidatus Levybacteria bacterium CG_4_9_14_0_2_um_filter_35_21]
MIPFIIFLFAYLGFGLFLISKTKLKLSVLENSVLAIMLSIAILSSLIGLLGQLLGVKSYYLLLVALLIGLFQTKKIIQYIKILCLLLWTNKIGSLFILICISIFSSTMILSGITKSGSISLQEVHDSTWHIALIENLQTSIPPLHPSTSSLTLNNYHYFYDIFLAGFAKFSTISPFVLYYQYSVVFLSVILISSAYILGKKLNGKLSGYLLIGMTIFAGSFAYLIPIFNPGQMWHESSFWVSQTLVMIVNPQIIYTLATLYLFIFLLKMATESNPKKIDYLSIHTLLIILASTSIGFKSYAWVILTTIYGLFLLLELIKYKSKSTIYVGLAYLLVSSPLIWLITKFKGGSFFYQPMWFTNSMIESPDRVNYLEWKFLQDHYLFKKNWIRFYIIEIKKVAIFYFGNLGIRSFFIGLPIVILLRKKFSFTKISFYVFFGFLFSSIFPLIFLQRGTVWNSIQFWYYSLIFANILFVIFVSEIIKKKSSFIIGIIFTIIFALAIPTSVKTIQDKNRTPYILGNNEVLFLQSLSSDEKILICPEGSNLYESSLIRSLTLADIYFANPGQLDLVGSDLKINQELKTIFEKSDIIELNKLFEANEITMIICSDKGMLEKLSAMVDINSIEEIGILKILRRM